MKKFKKIAGDNIGAENSSWSFGGNVAKKFNNHIFRSIPFYLEGHKIINYVSDFFLKKNSICYDLGCSTGTLINKLNDRHKNKSIKFYGIDSIKEMISFSKKINSKKKFNKVFFIKKDLERINFKKSDLIISYYTMQFLRSNLRCIVLKKIYKSLNLNGALIIFEKIRASDARFQDILNAVYNEFKIDNNYSHEEIMNKYRSLKGVLEPFTNKQNVKLLKVAGFRYITSIFQWSCFKGYLCIK